MNRTQFAFLWLDYAHDELGAKPNSVLIQLTTAPSQDSLLGWNELVEYVYLKPNTLEESLYSLEIRDVLRIALENALVEAEKIKGPDSYATWQAKYVLEAERLAEMLNQKDPVVWCEAAVRVRELHGYMMKRLKELKSVYQDGYSGGMLSW